jgi:LacI family transcriptional regulator
MAYNDGCAQVVMDACHMAHLKVPDQIQIVGVDNEKEICENTIPTLTSVLPDFEGGGYLAAKMLGEMLDGRRKPRSKVLNYYGVKKVVVRASTQDLKGGGRLVTLAREFIRLHAGEKISVKDIAAELKVSRRTLENRFREILNCGVADVLRDERLEHVASLLRETDRTATDISYDSGFSSPTYLAGLFKRTYGMTMGEWRSGQHI